MSRMSKLKDVIEGLSRVPKVVVFDIGKGDARILDFCLYLWLLNLDYTLWPFHIDCHGTQPFTPDG